MELLAQDRPALITGAQEGDTGPAPPGTENVATLFEIVGIGIFLALLVGAAVILIRRRRNS
jgi:LPXTG-motif cell wall-anchored protein